MSFKENWEKTDEVCPNFNQVTKRYRGLSRQNLIRLITPKFDINELVITFMIIMMIILAYAYKNETQICRDWVKPMFESDKEHCISVCDSKCLVLDKTGQKEQEINVTNLNEMLNEMNANHS